MTFLRFIQVISQYKKCPNCNVDWKIKDNLTVSLYDESITIKCACGFHKTVDENDDEIKKDVT